MAKFKTRATVVTAIRVSDPNIGTVGSWLVMSEGGQSILTNEEFLQKYVPAGRGEAKQLYNQAEAEANQTADAQG